MSQNWTKNIMIDDKNSTFSGVSGFNVVNNFANTNNISQGSDIIVISHSSITNPSTSSIDEYATQKIYQTPSSDENMSVNPNLGLPPERIVNTYNSANFSLEENGAISVALSFNDSFVWIYKNQEQLKNTLNSLNINYGFRKN